MTSYTQPAKEVSKLTGGDLSQTETELEVPSKPSDPIKEPSRLGKTEEYQPSIKPYLVQSLPQVRREWHKEILFGLFLRSDEEELREMSEQALPPLIIIKSKENHFGNHSSLTLVESSPDPPVLTLIPEVLRDFHPLPTRNSHVPRNEHVTLSIPAEWKRNDLPSRRLSEVERDVASRFLHPSTSGKAPRSPTRLKAKESWMKERMGLSFPDCCLKKKSITNPQGFSGYPVSENFTDKFSSSDNPMRVEPFSLLFNECSLAAISKWATGSDHDWTREDQEKHSTMDSTVFHRPVAAPFFRRCSSCRCWGHYEVECCDQLQEKDVLHLSESTKVQKTLRSYVEGENSSIPKGKRASGFADLFPFAKADDDKCSLASQSSVSFPKETAKQEEDEEYLIKSNGCEVCGSGFKGEDLLLCDGCDGLFHRQCLDPPLESVPEGDWFCNRCATYDSDVSSVVEIEGCGAFIIEQRKRSMAQEEACTAERNAHIGFPEEGWSTAVSVIRRDTFTDEPDKDEEDSGADREIREEAMDMPVLAPGELCWAKRRAAPKGLGRDDWWPAMVMVVLDMDTRSNSHARALGVNQTPYVVKFFSLMGAGRVRASDVLPFFEYYERIGLTRLFDQDKTGYEEYRKALNEAMLEMGCTTLAHVLKKAREITGKGSSKNSTVCQLGAGSGAEEANRLTSETALERSHEHEKNHRPREWHNADVDEEDGVEILARSMREIKPAGNSVWDERRYNNDKKLDDKIYGDESDLYQNLHHNAKAIAHSKAATLSTNGESFPSVKKIVGGMVAWVSRKPLDQTGSLAGPYHLEHHLEETESKLQLGIVSSLDLLHGEALVRSLPDLDRLSANITAARVQASYDDDEEEDVTPAPSLHSFCLGASLWVPIETLTLVGKAPSPQTKSACQAALTAGLQTARAQVRKRQLDKAREREETMVELVSRPASANQNSAITLISGERNSRKKMRRTLDNDALLQSNLSDTASFSSFGVGPAVPASGVEPFSTHNSGAMEAKENDANTSLGRGIYHAERIIGERRINGAMEYFIKWRGFDVADSTWEPEKNILNQNLVIVFKAESLRRALEDTNEAKDASSLTFRVIQAIKKARGKLTSGIQVLRGNERKVDRICPFCMAHFRDGSSFGGHSKRHASEPNYRLIREVSRFVERDWFDV